MTPPGTLPRKVAVIGAGDIGCGWAALVASAGWPVTIFDINARAMERALYEVPRRTRALVALGRATQGVVERGLLEHRQARSLLQAVGDADWVIEAVTEDLMAKQKLLAAVDDAAPAAALISSSSSGLAPKDVFGMCRRRARCLVIHPLNPPELVPLVEVIAGPETGRDEREHADGYLRALGRVPVHIRKPVPGYVVGRIAAAVWRECVDLVLRGVVDVDDLDRAVSLGPALGWAAAGPHLTYHLGAGDAGVKIFLQRLLRSFEEWWSDLATWHRLEPEQQRALIQAIESAYAEKIERLREARDRRLSAILRALEQAREP
ncbi:MAG TPA: 3-hydroxyacyl-CoA dehydrogenase NAD-binding domain-containing protein [Gemmatimonadales bacterium]|nr:3-hydroxyacyl-CoA dehydrogenase NAD-binding domain-containing protein [Gemmatimonadales bacterium]